jgi:hypothetical protein
MGADSEHSFSAVLLAQVLHLILVFRFKTGVILT